MMVFFFFSFFLTLKARRGNALFFPLFPLSFPLQLSHGFSMHPELEGLPKFDIHDIYEK